jgi:hypothetical protein
MPGRSFLGQETLREPNMARITPPALADLFSRYLRDQADAQALGLGYAESSGEVVPHDAVPVQPIDPRQAWDEALAVLTGFPGLPAVQWPVPPDWPALMTSQEPAVALAFCLGNSPQLVRNLQPLLTADPGGLRVQLPRPTAPSMACDWAVGVRSYPLALLAAGILRLAGEFERAGALLAAPAPANWQAVRANEQAALAWHRGQPEEAAALWQAQAPTVPVLFNRGLAALALGDFAAGRDALTAAAAALPETSSWHHLGQLYLALAAVRA